MGIFGADGELNRALKELERLKASAAQVKADGTSQYNAGWHKAIDLRNLLISAEAVTRAALTRQESRGGHTRLDFEGESEEWGRYNIVVKKGSGGRSPSGGQSLAGGMIVEKVERREPPAELKKIAMAKIEDLEKGNSTL